MIDVVQFDPRPLRAGESRELVLSGDGPFQVMVSCFVDRPPPPGFRPCAACGKTTVRALERFRITTDREMWRRKEGSVQIDIVDATGEEKTLILTISVDPDYGSSSSFNEMTM